MLEKLTPFLLVPLLLAGCSLAPGYERPSAPVSGRWPTGDSAAATAIDWKSFFGDARLKKLVDLALANNRDVRTAALNVEQVRAQYRIQRSQLFPNVNGGASVTRQHSDAADVRHYDISVGVASYELDLFGRVRSLNQAALEQYLASGEAARGAKLALVSEVATQYLVERALLDQIALSERTLEATSKTYELMKRRFDAGDVSELDLQSVDIQVQTARVTQANYRQQLGQTRNALTLLVGGPLPAKLPEGRSLGDNGLLDDLSPGLPSDLLTRRPDIREAEHNLLAAHADIGAARAAFFPSVTLTGSAGTAGTSFSKLFQSGSGAWAFAPQISVPIFTGGRLKASLDAAEIRRQIEVARYEKAIQTAFREVADALVARNGLRDRIAATEALVSAQQKRYELADARYQRGVDSYFQVLDAQQALYLAQQGLIQLHLARLTNRVELYKALGGGW